LKTSIEGEQNLGALPQIPRGSGRERLWNGKGRAHESGLGRPIRHIRGLPRENALAPISAKGNNFAGLWQKKEKYPDE
jgi:hypothetical protein